MAVIEIYFVTTVASRHHLLSSVFPVLGGMSYISVVLKMRRVLVNKGKEIFSDFRGKHVYSLDLLRFAWL